MTNGGSGKLVQLKTPTQEVIKNNVLNIFELNSYYCLSVFIHNFFFCVFIFSQQILLMF